MGDREQRTDRKQAYLSVDDVVERYAGVWSKWQIRELARRGELPNVKLPGRKSILFPIDQLERYEAGEVDLEMVMLPHGGRICRLLDTPITQSRRRA